MRHSAPSRASTKLGGDGGLAVSNERFSHESVTVSLTIRFANGKRHLARRSQWPRTAHRSANRLLKPNQSAKKIDSSLSHPRSGQAGDTNACSGRLEGDFRSRSDDETLGRASDSDRSRKYRRPSRLECVSEQLGCEPWRRPTHSAHRRHSLAAGVIAGHPETNCFSSRGANRRF